MHPLLFRFSGVDYLYAIGAIAVVAIIASLWAVRRRRTADLVPGLAIAVLFCVALLLLWIFGKPLTIWGYGLMLMLGFACGIAWAVREARMRGIAADTILDLAFFVLLGSIIGARLVHVFLEWEQYRIRPIEILTGWGWGLSFHGGVLGALIAGLIFVRARRISFWTLADVTAPSTALGYAIGRIGCLFRGCCHGGPTSLPWALRFIREGTPDLAHATPADLTPPSHPTQLYAALASLVIFAILLWLRGRLRVRGQLFLVYLILYSVIRWPIEILRRGGGTADPIWRGAWLTEAQVASMAIIVASAVGIWVLARREARAASHATSHKSERNHSQSRRSRERRSSG